MTDPDEQWRPVAGFEGLYEVSNLGRVKTLRRYGVPERIHKGHRNTHRAHDGHIDICLRKDGRNFSTQAHRLVMLAFVGPRPDRADIRHLNGDPTDNRLVNLAYGSRSENLRDQVRHGVHFSALRTHCPKNHPYDEENTYYKPSRPNRICRTCQRERKRKVAA